jgi:hypothetical protein
LNPPSQPQPQHDDDEENGAATGGDREDDLESAFQVLDMARATLEIVVVCSSIVACTRLLPIVIVVVIVCIAAKVKVGSTTRKTVRRRVETAKTTSNRPSRCSTWLALLSRRPHRHCRCHRLHRRQSESWVLKVLL